MSRVALFAFSVSLIACANSHATENDLPDASPPDVPGADVRADVFGGTDAGPSLCNDDGPRPDCVAQCGGADGFIAAICVGTEWVCPPGAFDSAFCTGPCPEGIEPRNPDAPGSACSFEGATCSEGTQCGSALFCTCEAGSWNCAIAEPDPACWCERAPTAGEPCLLEPGVQCGTCCPTLAGPNWPSMSCQDGVWEHTPCPDVECPELLLECPVEVSGLLGTRCAHEDQSCGEPCCGSVQCRGGVWQPGPALGCACEASPTCGEGRCTRRESCQSRCGPDDGVEFLCVALPAGCENCACMPLGVGQRCEMIDGQVRIFGDEFCG